MPAGLHRPHAAFALGGEEGRANPIWPTAKSWGGVAPGCTWLLLGASDRKGLDPGGGEETHPDSDPLFSSSW